MTDIAVTVPWERWTEWLDEGDRAGDEWRGRHYAYTVRHRPRIEPGERVYVVARDKLRGYGPLVALSPRWGRNARGDWQALGWELIRAGEAVALTIPATIPGFRGYRYRWWDRAEEIPFPDWKDA